MAEGPARGYMESRHMTLRRCLMKLSDVRMYVSDDEVGLEKAITRERRELLELCGDDPARLAQSARASIFEVEVSGRRRSAKT